MQTFQVTSPDICGLVINGAGNAVLAFLPNTTQVCYANDSATFEEFTTVDAAATRAVAVQPDYDLANIYGTATLVPVNVSSSSVTAVVGGAVTLNAEYSLSGGTLTYQWRTASGIIIPGATNSSLVFSDPVEAMTGSYVCDVVGTVTATKAVGTASPEVNLTVFKIPLSVTSITGTIRAARTGNTFVDPAWQVGPTGGATPEQITIVTPLVTMTYDTANSEYPTTANAWAGSPYTFNVMYGSYVIGTFTQTNAASMDHVVNWTAPS